MANRILLILLLILLAVPVLAQEDNGTYRVDVMVFRLLEPANAPNYSDAIPEHGPALDITVLRAGGLPPAVPADPLFPAPEDHEVLPPVGPFPDDLPWSRITHLEEGSEQIRAAWRNLRLSAEYRPEILLSWEQPTDSDSPLVFLHNEQVLAVEDPWLPLRTVPPTRVLEQPDEDEPDPPPVDHLFLYDLPGGALRLTTMPLPRDRYQIEGTVRLRRERFLHIDLDLTWTATAPGVDPANAGVPLRAELLGYEVFSLKQSRQVRKERMEYFDSPYLGVLVLINEFEPVQAEVMP